MNRRGPSFAALAALAVAALAGCGYRVVGVGGRLPGNITQVEVPVFENQTTRTDAGRVLTQDFISQLLAAAKVRVAGSQEAQALIQGVVTGYKRDPITFDSKQKPLENRLTIVMDVTLTRRFDRRVLFTQKGVTVHYDYPVKTDLQENDRLEDEALHSVSELMSQKLVSLMLEGF
jgi:outer membrane lipopolysaccharide assembly protein LptE/RlpB